MPKLVDQPIHTRFKLSALWASAMFFYIYCDYFELYVPGKIERVMQGNMGPLGNVSQGLLLGTAILMAVPSLMVFLSLVLPARLGRTLNIVTGAFYTLLLAIFAFLAQWHFYRLYAFVEALLTAMVVWHAWKWPRAERPA